MHKPQYIKQICQPGQNSIQISTNALAYYSTHLFVLQLVYQPSVSYMIHCLKKKRHLPKDHCIAKIWKWFALNTSALDGVQQTGVKVSLKCPITYRKIVLPARGKECNHIQCFDLESYLQINCDRGKWRCPVCNNNAEPNGLEIDQFFIEVLRTLNEKNINVGEVTVDPEVKWTYLM